MRKMYDGLGTSTDVQAIAKVIQPGDVVAYYIDGEWAWSDHEIGMFPFQQHVTITVTGVNYADVVDCEFGDVSPDGAAKWVRMMKARGYWRPSIYRSFALMGDVRKSTGELVMGKDWDSWVAHYDNDPHQDYPGSAAKQYETTPFFDLSSIYDNAWPHRRKVPVPPPVGPKWPAGEILKFGSRNDAVYVLQRTLRDSGLYGVRGIVVDGVFADQTRTAVRNFEKYAHITVDDGIAGPQVRTALIVAGLMSEDGHPA